jgi:hypothetical protein
MRLAVLFAFAFAFALALARPPVADAEAIPRGPTPLEKLTTKKFRHHEVMRIDRDFGMAKWELALDSWTPHDVDAHVEDVRLWWVNTAEGDRRKPFSAHLQRHIEFGYRRDDTGTLAVRMAGDSKEYLFTVEIDANGVPAVFADIELADGSDVTHCRGKRGRLTARRVLGIPVGISALHVTCIDDAMQRHEGTLPHREVADGGKAYKPE